MILKTLRFFEILLIFKQFLQILYIFRFLILINLLLILRVHNDSLNASAPQSSIPAEYDFALTRSVRCNSSAPRMPVA